jgi:excisionase family DNA binding protein
MKGYLTTEEAAEKLNVVSLRVRRMILDGVIKAEKVGRDNFILESEVKQA